MTITTPHSQKRKALRSDRQYRWIWASSVQTLRWQSTASKLMYTPLAYKQRDCDAMFA